MTNLNILYEDNHIIVVEKPANILSQSDITTDIDMLTIIKGYIKERYNKPGNVYLGLVHRLDRPTSGVMVFAKTSKAASRLSSQIKNHQMKKTYLAIVKNIIKEDIGTYEDYLEKQENRNSIVSKNGKYAKLTYKVLKKDYQKNQTLVEIDLETGRHHQIRVQFSSRKNPLLGDFRYGNETEKRNLCLHSYKLKFIHPTTKELMEFVLEPPTNIDWTLFTRK